MATTTNYSWTTPDDTDLVKDGAAAIRTLGTAIDATVFTNAGAAVAKATVDAKGDLIAGTADNTIARLAVGANGTTLVADSSTATGLAYRADTVNTVIDAEGDLLVGDAADTVQRLAIGSNAQVLTVDTSVDGKIKWAAPSVSALTLIKTQTIGTAVTSITVSDAFSSTYDNYLITINGGVSSASATLGLKLGAGSSNYWWNGIYMNPSSATVNGENSTSATSFRYVAGADTTNIAGIVTLIGPNLAKPTNAVYDAWRSSSNRINLDYRGSEDASTQHTAFTLEVDGGANVTGGTIRVYGFKNS
jgi:hypothetical protein